MTNRIYSLLLCMLIIALSPSSQASEAEATCENNVEQCLIGIKAKLDDSDYGSHSWFYLRLELIDLLFVTQRYQEVLELVDELLLIEKLPPKVLLTCNMYKVKLHKYYPQDNVEQYTQQVD
ncbi:MAG: hypothetical protein HWE10_14925 [Gammaproteobacteria bacterium]|nr:hypothetical protein [Gammaproteobacteria bacterium]